jgi:glucose/arabinose dehydrogenase
MRSLTASLVLVAGIVALAAVAPFAQGEGDRSQLQFRKVADGFSQPVYVAQPKREPGRFYLVERAGKIVTLARGKRSTFLDIRSRVESGYDEQGLLSVAFHPRYATNHRFFVYYTNRQGDIEVDAYRSRRGRAVASSRRRLLLVPHRTNDNHDGGQLQFGPEGLLYAGTGDGGSGGDPPNNSQNLSRRLGKLLRYSGGTWRIAAYGLRNPWRFSFDRATGDLLIGDVGQNEWEEIDYRPRAQALRGLTNYGWSAYEGEERFEPSRLNRRGTLVGPIQVYRHGGNGCSVTGGYVYRGRSVAPARGRYFYGDYCSGIVWSLRVEGGKAVDNRRETRISSLSSFGEAANGELYAVSLDGGLYRLSG